MRVLFINTPRWHVARSSIQGLVGDMSLIQPIGMLYLSSYLKQHAEVEVALFDYILEKKQDYAVIDDLLLSFRPDVVGLTTLTFTLYDTFRICRHVKQNMPQAKIVLGGKHIDIYPHETLTWDCVDYLVQGEGEKPILALVQALAAGETQPEIEGLWYRRNGGVHDGGRASRIEDLDSLPFPDVSILPSDRYGRQFTSDQREASIISSRGCPYACAYCTSSHRKWTRWIERSPENIVQEMQMWIDHGFTAFNFLDDNFNTDLDRAKELCRQIVAAGFNLPWTMRGSINNFDEEFVSLLAEAGCRAIMLGVESANDDILRRFNRRSGDGHLQKTFRLLTPYRIMLGGYFMLGFPGETKAMADKTIDLACALPLHLAHFLPVTPIPDTRMFEELLAQGGFEDVYAPHVLNPQPDFMYPYFEDKLSMTDMAALCSRAYRRFYLRPSLILRHLRLLTSPREFFHKAKLAATLIRYTLQSFLARLLSS